MKDTTKTIIIGTVVTILVLILALFILYKTSDNNEKKDSNPVSETRNTNNSNTPNDSQNNNTNPVSSENTNNTNNNQNNSSNNIEIKDNEANNKVILYMFHGLTCPHCVNAISKMQEERNTTFKNVEIRTYEVWKNKDNRELMQKVTDKLNVSVNSVPYFVIGNYNRVGFNSETILSEYKKALSNKDYQNIVEEVIKENPNLKPVYETI